MVRVICIPLTKRRRDTGGKELEDKQMVQEEKEDGKSRRKANQAEGGSRAAKGKKAVLAQARMML